MKAFLSHSSTDTDFVSSVAKQLGRQFCVFDTFQFQTGEDFRAAIRAALEQAAIFVLFASKKALESTWVNFEQDEAELLSIQGNINRPLVFLMDQDVTHNELPVWLRRGRVRTANAPRAVAREIHFHLQELIRDQQQALFVGRRRELSEAEERLLSYGEAGPPRLHSVFGLSGIGRRTIVKRVAADLLNLPKAVTLRVEEGDELQELAAKAAEHAELPTL